MMHRFAIFSHSLHGHRIPPQMRQSQGLVSVSFRVENGLRIGMMMRNVLRDASEETRRAAERVLSRLADERCLRLELDSVLS